MQYNTFLIGHHLKLKIARRYKKKLCNNIYKKLSISRRRASNASTIESDRKLEFI